MAYLILFCLSINWFVISASDVADGELHTLSKLSEQLHKETIPSNFENRHSRLFEKDLEYFKHERAKAIKEVSGVSSNEEENDNKIKDNVNRGASGDAVGGKLNGQTEHTGAVRRAGVKESYRSDHVKLGNQHDQNPASSYTTHSDYYNSAVRKSSDKDNEGPLLDGDVDLFADLSKPIVTFSDIKFHRAPQWDFKTNIKVLNLDTGSVSENTIERHDTLSRNTVGDDVRVGDSTLIKEIPFGVLSDSLDSEPQQNLIYSFYEFPILRRKPLSRISQLYRARRIMPFANVKQVGEGQFGQFGSYGPNAVAGTDLYGTYASAHTTSYPYGAYGYNEGPFGYGQGGEDGVEV